MIQRRDIEGVQSKSGPWESEGWETEGSGETGSASSVSSCSQTLSFSAQPLLMKGLYSFLFLRPSPSPPFPFLASNKLPQAGWLKTKEPYSVTVLHTSSLNQGVSSIALRENPVPAYLLAFGHCLEVSSIFWFINTPFQSLPLSSHCFLLCVSLC